MKWKQLPRTDVMSTKVHAAYNLVQLTGQFSLTRYIWKDAELVTVRGGSLK